MTSHMQSMLAQHVNTDPDSLFEAFTERRALKEWLSHEALTVPTVGGPLCLWWKDGTYAVGEFLELDRPHRIRMTWQNSTATPGEELQVSFAKDGDGTLVSVCALGASGTLDTRWKLALRNLAVVLGDKGLDQRMIQRPDGTARASLGFFIGPSEIPVCPDLPPYTKGMRVVGTFPESSAHEAGLRKDDVVFEIAGHPVQDLFSFSRAMDFIQPGEQAEVRYVRSKIISRVNIESTAAPDSFPLPPTTAVEFASQLETLYSEFEMELDALLENITEELASWSPSDDSWCINDVIAHLIPFERMFHQWMGAAAVGFEPYSWVEHPRLWTDGLLEVFPKLSDLREELRRARAETIAYLKRLPKGLVQRPTYQRMGMIMLLDQFHPRHHHEQIKRILNTFKTKGDHHHA